VKKKTPRGVQRTGFFGGRCLLVVGVNLSMYTPRRIPIIGIFVFELYKIEAPKPKKKYFFDTSQKNLKIELFAPKKTSSTGEGEFSTVTKKFLCFSPFPYFTPKFIFRVSSLFFFFDREGWTDCFKKIRPKEISKKPPHTGGQKILENKFGLFVSDHIFGKRIFS